MIASTGLQFPANVIKVLVDAMPFVDDPEPSIPDNAWESIQIFSRPLRANDPNQAIGVFPDTWRPEEDSYEMLGGSPGKHRPTLENYFIGIHVLVKDMEEVRGQDNHAELAERVRDMLYEHQPLRLALASLTATTKSGRIVRAKRWGVLGQKFLANEFSGSWYFLATIQFYVEVENS